VESGFLVIVAEDGRKTQIFLARPTASQSIVDKIVGKGAPVPPAAPKGVQAPQLLGDDAQFLCGYGSKTRDFVRIGRAERPAKTLKVENVADEGIDSASIDEVAIQHAQETAHLDLLSCLLSDLTEKSLLDGLSPFDASGRQAIDRPFVTVLRMQQDFTVELPDCEYHLSPSVRIRLPPVGAQIGVCFDAMTAAKRLPVLAYKGLDFRPVYLGRYR